MPIGRRGGHAAREWRLAERDLGGRIPKGAVTYHVGVGTEGGSFKANADCTPPLPQIILWRTDHVPLPQDEPDLRTRPMEDACTPAHEYGHYLSDPLDTLHEHYEAIRRKEKIDRVGQERVLAEEERAWEQGREALAELGCTEWGHFEDCRQRSLKSYRDGFAGMN